MNREIELMTRVSAQAVAESASNKPDTAIAETGWPTGKHGIILSFHNQAYRTIPLIGSDWANTSSNGGGAEASAANLQTFLDTFVCQANANGTHYFFCESLRPSSVDDFKGSCRICLYAIIVLLVEAFDEPWKRVCLTPCSCFNQAHLLT
jgi:exo-beta-1,3-glucanase (GH17 family)